MSHTKQASKRKNWTKAVTVLGVAGVLSLAAGASVTAIGPAADRPTDNTASVFTLGEEVISDVSLATFYVFDNRNAGTHRGLTLVRERRHRGSSGSGGAVYGGGAIYGGGGGYGGGGAPTGAGGPDGM